jgi:hypothetical protein
LIVMVALVLSYVAFITLSNIPSIPSYFKAFIMKGYWILSKVFFLHLLRGSCDFFPCFCLYAVLLLWIYIRRTILASREWNPLVHGVCRSK